EKVDRGELADLCEARPGVGRTGWQVVVVDVERHGGHDGTRQLNYRRHRGSCQTPATQLRFQPDPLHLADRSGHRAEIGLEEHPIAFKDAERATRGDQLADVEAVTGGI